MTSLLTLSDLQLTPLATRFIVLAKDGELMKGEFYEMHDSDRIARASERALIVVAH
jgi:hypothetical protein